MLTSGADRQGLNNAYGALVGQVINEISNGRRKLQSSRHRMLQQVAFNPKTAKIYKLVDAACPDSAVEQATCQTVYARFNLYVSKEDAEAVYETYLNATQDAIEEGKLQRKLEEVDSGSAFFVERSSDPEGALSAVSSSRTPPVLEESDKDSPEEKTGLGILGIVLITAACAAVLVAIIAMSTIVPNQDRQKLLDSTKKSPEDTVAEDSNPGDDTDNDDRSDPPENEHRAAVVALVQTNCPDQLGNVDALLNQFSGREDDLIVTLQSMGQPGDESIGEDNESVEGDDESIESESSDELQQEDDLEEEIGGDGVGEPNHVQATTGLTGSAVSQEGPSKDGKVGGDHNESNRTSGSRSLALSKVFCPDSSALSRDYESSSETPVVVKEGEIEKSTTENSNHIEASRAGRKDQVTAEDVANEEASSAKASDRDLSLETGGNSEISEKPAGAQTDQDTQNATKDTQSGGKGATLPASDSPSVSDHDNTSAGSDGVGVDQGGRRTENKASEDASSDQKQNFVVECATEEKISRDQDVSTAHGDVREEEGNETSAAPPTSNIPVGSQGDCEEDNSIFASPAVDEQEEDTDAKENDGEEVVHGEQEEDIGAKENDGEEVEHDGMSMRKDDREVAEGEESSSLEAVSQSPLEAEAEVAQGGEPSVAKVQPGKGGHNDTTTSGGITEDLDGSSGVAGEDDLEASNYDARATTGIDVASGERGSSDHEDGVRSSAVFEDKEDDEQPQVTAGLLDNSGGASTMLSEDPNEDEFVHVDAAGADGGVESISEDQDQVSKGADDDSETQNSAKIVWTKEGDQWVPDTYESEASGESHSEYESDEEESEEEKESSWIKRGTDWVKDFVEEEVEESDDDSEEFESDSESESED